MITYILLTIFLLFIGTRSLYANCIEPSQLAHIRFDPKYKICQYLTQCSIIDILRWHNKKYHLALLSLNITDLLPFHSF
jgi:hypothetical protein